MSEAVQLARLVDTLRQDVVQRQHVEDRRALHTLVENLTGLGAPHHAGGLETSSIRTALETLAGAFLAHLDKEEHILFPALVAMADAGRGSAPRPLLPFPSLLHPIRVMERDHQALRQALADVAREAALVIPPPDLDEAWAAWRCDLDRFSADVQAHFAVEDQHFFPRALELEQSLP